jgi:putative endonuclease
MGPTGNRQQIGRHGEALAADFLRDKGWQIVARNLVTPIGEIDLVVRSGPTLVLVEVKTLRRLDYLHPVWKVDARKRRKLRQLAAYVAAGNPEQDIRVDVLTVYWCNEHSEPVIEHLENIF